MPDHPAPWFTSTLKFTLRWTLLAALVAVLAGSASALFLVLLRLAGQTHAAHAWLLWLLPLAGFTVGWIYLKLGKGVEAGNNLLIDEIHDPKQVIPLRMAPLVLASTVLSHLFGASVGREGTAVQMGGALADQITRMWRLGREERRLLLMAGIAAGFSSVFGTPLAGAVFALEVLAIGRLRYEALFPCLVAAVLADQVTLRWGIVHEHYAVGMLPALSAWNLTALVLAGAAFGLVGRFFAGATHGLTAWMARIPYAPLRPLLGGTLIAALAYLGGLDRYLGLGLPAMAQAFEQALPFWDFAGKFLFTVASLGSGFKGGEVTPLFFIGATLGNAMAPWLDLPLGLLAGVGFVAVFAGAANTPLACTLMAMELFGAGTGVFAMLGCVSSYLFSGHGGIYRAQRPGDGKRTSD